MKKIILLLICTTCSFSLVACNKVNNKESTKDNTKVEIKDTTTKNKKSNMSLKDKKVVNKAYNYLDKDMKSLIKDKYNTKIESFKTKESKYIVGTKTMTTDLKDLDTYKVTFTSDQDETHGPIIVYIEKESLEVLGREMRE